MDWTRCPQDRSLPWLHVSLIRGLTPAKLRALLDWAGTPQALLECSPQQMAAIAGEEIASALARGADRRLLDATLRWLEDADHHIVCPADPLYPRALLELADTPPVLYAGGRVELLCEPALAIVGSRNATAQGLRDAHSFAKAIAREGLAIVSGLAIGIDSAAHLGGLEEAASSIAILGNGPDIVYPPDNAALSAALAKRGCLLSEFSLGTPPLARNFPRRNRLISGMSKGVLVVEAGSPSGSLSTARFAIQQGREVFAIPGSIHSPLSKGCHRLIQEGAKLVQTASDVLDEIGWKKGERNPPDGTEEVEDWPADPVLDALGFGTATLEQLASRTGLDAASLAARVAMLELQGRLVVLGGGMLQAIVRQRRGAGAPQSTL